MDQTGFLPAQKLETAGWGRSFLERLQVIGQFDKKCIAASVWTEKETQIWMFDQHASHERVNLEKIMSSDDNITREDANMKACKSAFRFGDQLTHEDQTKIVTELAKCREPFHCAHGRPTCWLLARIAHRPLK